MPIYYYGTEGALTTPFSLNFPAPRCTYSVSLRLSQYSSPLDVSETYLTHDVKHRIYHFPSRHVSLPNFQISMNEITHHQAKKSET